jgi:hypothetical protein
MNHRFLSLILGVLVLAATSCNVNVNEGNTTLPNGTIPDSGTTVTTHSETHSETNSGFEVKGSIHSESHSTTHTTTTTGKQLTFAQQLDQWATDLFPDYKTVEMDPMEAYPLYDHAKETHFKRLRMKNPISNSYGKAVYPRVLLKAYRFGSSADLAKDVEAWLNSLGSPTKGIQLGQDVKEVKSPPLLCAVVGNDFLVAQMGCVYEGEEMTASIGLFMEKMKAAGASYLWQIKCKSGELVYES